MGMEKQIELLAEKAVRRIEREGKFADHRSLPRIHAIAVRAAQDKFEEITCSAVLHAKLHARINELCAERGLARRDANWLVAA
jgi:hypothetical protein